MPAPPDITAHKPHWHRDHAWKHPVRVATTTAGTLASSFENGDSVDGVTIATGDRILVKDQSSAAENGLYYVEASGAPTRAYDMNANTEVVGAIVYVVAGTDNGGTLWRTTNTTTPTLNTTAINWDVVATGSGGANPETVNTVAASGATETLDVSTASVHDVTLTADCTFTFTGAVNAEGWSFTLVLRQDGTGGWTTTWPGSVIWPGGSAPTLDETASTASVLTFFTLDGGTNWFGFLAGEGGGGGTPATTVEDETTWGITPAVGTDTEYARQDHTHGSPANPVTGTAVAALGFVGPILISDTPSTPLVFADLLQNEAQDDLLYGDPT